MKSFWIKGKIKNLIYPMLIQTRNKYINFKKYTKQKQMF